MSPIRIEHFDVMSVEAMVPEHVVHFVDVVLVVQTGRPTVPATRDQDCLIADSIWFAVGLNHIVAGLTPLGVVTDRIANQFCALVDTSEGRTRSKARDVGAACQHLASFFIMFHVDVWDVVDFAATGKVPSLLALLQSILAASFQG